MPRKCSICESEHLKAIDKSLVGNDSIRAVAERYGMALASVHRHKTNHLPKLLMKAKAIEEVADADSLLDQTQNLLATAKRLMKRAEDEGAIDTALRGVSQYRAVLELLGEVRGELNGKGTTVNVAVAVGAAALGKPLSLYTDDELDVEWAKLQREKSASKGVLEGVFLELPESTDDSKSDK